VLLVRDCLFVIPKYAYFAADLYILEVCPYPPPGTRVVAGSSAPATCIRFHLYLYLVLGNSFRKPRKGVQDER